MNELGIMILKKRYVIEFVNIDNVNKWIGNYGFKEEVGMMGVWGVGGDF